MLADRYIIMLSGKAGAGKSTIANELNRILKEDFGYQSYVISYATPLKAVCRYFGWDGKKDKRGRKFLIDLGKVAREYNEDVFAALALKDADDCFGDFDFLIIDDWRFINEYTYAANRDVSPGNPISIRIDPPFSNALEGTEAATTQSETELDTFSFDFVVPNTKPGSEEITKISKIIVKSILEKFVKKL